jgi:5'-3' exonuclease
MVYLVAQQEVKLRRVIVVSGDKDMMQLVNHDISVHKPHPKYPVMASPFAFSCHEPFVEIHQIVDYYCMVGDHSDDIPGIKGVGPSRAVGFLRRFGSIKNYLEDDDAIYTGMMDKDKVKKIWKRNRRLMDLAFFHKKYQPNAKVRYYKKKAFPQFNDKKFLQFCLQYNMKVFRMPSFQKPFKDIC